MPDLGGGGLPCRNDSNVFIHPVRDTSDYTNQQILHLSLVKYRKSLNISYAYSTFRWSKVRKAFHHRKLVAPFSQGIIYQYLPWWVFQLCIINMNWHQLFVVFCSRLGHEKRWRGAHTVCRNLFRNVEISEQHSNICEHSHFTIFVNVFISSKYPPK